MIYPLSFKKPFSISSLPRDLIYPSVHVARSSLENELVSRNTFGIVINEIYKSFNSVSILNGASLSIKKNEVVAIIGPSGSGKSTFLRCINHIEEPDAGTISIDGVQITKHNLAHIRKNIGMVFQHFNLFPHMTVLENITYAPMRVLNMRPKAAYTLAHELLAKVHMQKFGDAYPANLSGGQKQRVAIVRALAMQPQIMLFDEPTSALDPEMVKEVLAVIKSLVHTGITIVIVTHLMSFARESADKIVFFADGKIIETASPAQFFHNPSSARAREFLNRIL